ncbi:hypothetical protein [Actinoallomurus sp. CA-150999]
MDETTDGGFGWQGGCGTQRVPAVASKTASRTASRCAAIVSLQILGTPQ